jgi:hypothetical protein
MKSHAHVIALCLGGLLAGCATSGGMLPSAGAEPAQADRSQVVFMRSTALGQAINASIYDVTEGSTRFIGVVPNKTKQAYSTTPGEHTFMVVAESADFMKATLLPGKTYYALVTPRMGVWKARFSFRPLRQSDLTSDEFAGWDKDTKWVHPGPEATKWAQQNAADIEAKRAKYWPEWSSKDEVQRKSQTLNPEDGK